MPPGQFPPRPQAWSCDFPDYLSTFPHPRITGSPLPLLADSLEHLTHGHIPSSGRAPSAIYLCIYLFIYLLLYLISWLHPGIAWLPQLDWEGKGQDQQGRRSLLLPFWVWGATHPYQSQNSLGRGLEKWEEAEPADPQLSREEPSEGPIWGQVPGLLSLPLLYQEALLEPLPLFLIYSSFRGTPGSRDRLSPGPRWGLWPAPGRSALSRPRLCNSPGQRGRDCQPGAYWPPLPPTALLHARARTEAHTSARTGPAPSALSTLLFPRPSVFPLWARVLDTQTSFPSP